MIPLLRPVLLVAQAAIAHTASRNRHVASAKTQYARNAPAWLLASTYIFPYQSPLFISLATLEVVSGVYNYFPSGPVNFDRSFLHCSNAAKALSVSPLFIFGFLLSVASAALRLACYSALGERFTFDPSLLPNHELVTSGPYAFVRHPAYLGVIGMNVGLSLTYFASGSGSLLIACGWIDGAPASFTVSGLLALYWGYYLAVGRKRCQIEDAKLRTVFGKQWEEYAARVPWWYVPGIY